MQALNYGIVAVGTVLWCLPFLLVRSKSRGSLTQDRRARWGIALKCAAYTLLWQGRFWERTPALRQTLVAAILFAVACALSWSAAFALGRQLRLDAALSADHELVRSGPYRLVRHPIYTSMLGVLVGTGVLIAPWYLLAPAIVLFLIGAAIRIRVEDALLESRFGEQFRTYRLAVL
jgi:protein-S-isoprenylcysteine O-methyltransferase Ste14